MILLSARMSRTSFQRWRRLPAMIRPLLQRFDLCLTQDALQAQRFERLGARHVLAAGDLKATAAPLPVDAAGLREIETRLGTRPRWLAASTHEGEEELAGTAHRLLKDRFPRLLTIVAPRHPGRGAEIARRLALEGLSVARRSRGETIADDTDIYLADTLGELGLFYRVSGIAFIGGSTSVLGGHNPLEAALLDCAILLGPDTANAKAISDALRAAHGAETVRDAQEMAQAVTRLLADPDERQRRATAAAGVAARQSHVLDGLLDRLAPWLDRLETDAALRA
jgi:3-deoxy-D-manno-octulosonic-acid transferase